MFAWFRKPPVVADPTAMLDLKARIMLGRARLTNIEHHCACSSPALLGYLHQTQYNPFHKRTSR